MHIRICFGRHVNRINGRKLAIGDTSKLGNTARFHGRDHVTDINLGHFTINCDRHGTRIHRDIAATEIIADPINHPAVMFAPTFLEQPLL